MSKCSNTERPALFSGSEARVSLFGVDLQVSHFRTLVVLYDDIGHVHDSDKVLVHGFGVVFQFQQLSINFVHHQHGHDSFSHCLS